MLTRPQREVLEFLATTDVFDIADHSVINRLEARGFVERFEEDGTDCWRITPSGRAALAGEGGET